MIDFIKIEETYEKETLSSFFFEARGAPYSHFVFLRPDTEGAFKLCVMYRRDGRGERVFLDSGIHISPFIHATNGTLRRWL